MDTTFMSVDELNMLSHLNRPSTDDCDDIDFCRRNEYVDMWSHFNRPSTDD
jgi:hypothetical protein